MSRENRKSKLCSIIDRILGGIKTYLSQEISYISENETVVFGTGLGRIEFIGRIKVWFIVRVNAKSIELTTHVVENNIGVTLQDISAILSNWQLVDETHLIWSIEDSEGSEEEVVRNVANAIISFYNTYK